MEQTPKQLRNEKLGAKVVKAMESRHFEAYYCGTKEEALKKALELIPEGSVVAWGGSVTMNEIGLSEALHNGKYQLIDRDAAPPEERRKLMRQGLLADYFISGANAVSEDGEIVNIDGMGNRVGAIVYGPDHVVIIAGMNKVAKTLEDAVKRARTIAAPINKQRFGGTTPCAKTGSCGDCKAEDCICCQMLVTRVCRPAGRIKVILVGEDLGF